MYSHFYKKVMALGPDSVAGNEDQELVKLLTQYGITDSHIEHFFGMNKPLKDVLGELAILKAYKEGKIDYPFVISSATFANGFLKRLSYDEFMGLLNYYDKVVVSQKSPTAYVPAAGAASRQFQLMKIVIGKFFSNCQTPEDILKKATAITNGINAKDKRKICQMNTVFRKFSIRIILSNVKHFSKP